jgi:hypothetical protein
MRIDPSCGPTARIAGASCGLAASLALLHLVRGTVSKRTVATGMIQAIARTISEIKVGQVDNIAYKLHASIDARKRILFPADNLQPLLLTKNWISAAFSAGAIGPTGIAIPVTFLEEAYSASCA